MSAILAEWGFVNMQWVREQLVSMSEYNFEVLPTDVLAACKGKWGGFGGTVLIEEAMQLFEGVGHDSKMHSISRRRRWRCLQRSSLLGDYGETGIRAEPCDVAAAAPKLCDSTLGASRRAFSIGPPELDAISNPKWSSPSPATFDEIPMSLLALKYVQGDWIKLKNTSCLKVR